MRKVTRSEFALAVSLIKVAPKCEPGQKVGNYRTCQARAQQHRCGIDRSIDPTRRSEIFWKITRSNYIALAAVLIESRWVSARFIACRWSNGERLEARKLALGESERIVSTRDDVPSRAGVTHSRRDSVQRVS